MVWGYLDGAQPRLQLFRSADGWPVLDAPGNYSCTNEYPTAHGLGLLSPELRIM